MLITGASGALGSEIAHYFSKQSICLALHYKSALPKQEETSNCKYFKADLTKEDQVKSMVSNIVKTFGRIDIVVNNAGISKSSISWKTNEADWSETLAVNLTAPFLVSKYAIPELRKQTGGRIINISSVVAQTGFVGTVAYAASKSGLIGMTKTLAKELAPFKITVNALALGYFNQGMIDDVPEDMQQAIIESVPLKTLGDPKTINKMLETLVSDEGDFITGQTLNLNGGLF